MHGPPVANSEPVVDMLDLATYATDRRIIDLAHDGKAILVTWDDDRQSRFHALWLRDNCACPECRHPTALERQWLFVDMPEPVLVSAAMLTSGGAVDIQFAGPKPGAPHHTSRFDAGWLRHHSYAAWARRERSTRRQLWDADLERDIPRFEHGAVMQDDAVLRRWLEALRDVGVTLVVNAPPVDGEGRRIAERIGFVRETNFGHVFDVQSKPDPNASAYTAIGLEPHTDLANVAYPPDYQLLFCIVNDAEGGGSVLVDGFRVAEELLHVDPEAFLVLATQPVAFRFHDRTCDLRHRSLVIERDRDGDLLRIRFNNWLRCAPDLPEEVTEDFYRALAIFWRLLRNRRFQLRPRLGAGEMLAFDNRRVLHGRDPFAPETGRRHFQGCYIDRDNIDSRLRILARDVF
jgi:gamma-butyrobetaine dioxygenase